MATERIPLQELEQIINTRPADWRHPRVDVVGLQRELQKQVEGEVRFDSGTRAMYAVDGGNYRQVPIGVVAPRSLEDVMQTVAASRKFNAPILSRGGGTSLCGQCCNVAIVIDWSKYMSRIIDLDSRTRTARVLPGTICDELRHAAARHNLTWGPDPATHTHCTFGGMLGNNSCGAHAQMAGKAVDNTEELDILLYDGTRMTVGWMTEGDLEAKIRLGGREGQIYRNLRSLRHHYAGLIENNYPKIPRRVSGYNLDELIPGADGRFNVARALVGSEGTLVTILTAKVRLVPARAQRVVLLLGYDDVYAAADHVPEILANSEPVALEGMDHLLVKNLEKKGGPHRRFIQLLPEGAGWLMLEFGADTKKDAEDQARQLLDRVQGKGGIRSSKLYTEDKQCDEVWELRESGLGATAFVPGEPITWEGWEDSAVAPDKAGAYLRDLCSLYEKYGYLGALYGHFGQGCIHTRITFDLMSRPGIDTYHSFMEEATDLVTRYGGSLSGEHGDGQSKAQFLHKMFGPELIEAFREFKSIWDPDWKMNPGKVVDPYTITENLRLGADYDPWDPPTHFQFPNDHGSFAHAALRCVGVGKCRRKEGKNAEDNTMCPSFMVTMEERDTTRGRAHHLWEMLHGDVIQKGWRDDAVKESLDLCLSCKGCKGDCPVNVDMATYKAEFLSHYWEGRLRPRYAYAFGLIDQWARLASAAPGFANLFTQLPGLRNLAKLAAGMPQKRAIPAFAPESFTSWFGKRQPRNQGQKKVVLWPDTFNNFFFPETAQAAVQVLEHAGFQVDVPQGHVCCGRPLYDYGFLDRARRYLEHDMRVLGPHLDGGASVVVLEPSCCSVFRDELIEMFPENSDAHKVADNTFTLSEFLEQKAKNYTIPKLKRDALVQSHCHHKAIMRLYDEESVMKKMELNANVLASGCCGMAGSFGYEADKYGVSIACGERKLLPEVRRAGLSTIVMADGFSCKEQIAQETTRQALHLAEVIQLAIKEGPYGPKGIYPEDPVVQPRRRAVKKSMVKAGAISGAIVAGALLGGWLWKRAA